MRATISLLLGGWLLGSLLLGGVAAENFFMIDTLLRSPTAHPSFQKDVAQLSIEEARPMLRYLVSELNRFYFNVWGWLELVLGLLVLAFAMRTLKGSKFTIGFSAMLAVVAVMDFYITPKITQVGRGLDFVPRQTPPPGMAEFGILHATYSLLDLAKLLIGIWMAVALIRLPSQETRKREPVVV